jgi:hypothetical protein
MLARRSRCVNPTSASVEQQLVSTISCAAIVVTGSDARGLVADFEGASGSGRLTGSILEKCALGLIGRGHLEIGVFDSSATPRMNLAWFLRYEPCEPDIGGLAEEIEDLIGSMDVSVLQVQTIGDSLRPARRAIVSGSSGLSREPGIRKVTFHRRRLGITQAAYVDGFRSHQVVADVHHSNAARYRQSVVVAVEGGPVSSFDGVSEHWYHRLLEAREEHFSREDSPSIVQADVVKWLDVPSAMPGYAICWRTDS